MQLTAPFAIPDQQLPDPTRRLSPEFLRAYPSIAGLWTPSKLIKAAADFNPTKKNFGALNGGVTIVSANVGIFGEAWKFDGNTGDITTPPAIDGTSDCSLIALVKPAAKVGGLGNVIFGGVGTSTNRAIIWTVEDTKMQFFSDELNSVGNSSAVTYSAGDWCFCGVTFNNSTFATKFYFAKVGQALADVSSTNNTASLFSGYVSNRIGQDPANSLFFGGQIVAVFAYRKILTLAQVSALYSSLLYGEPYRLFAPSVMERFYGAGAAPSGKVPWQLFQSRAA